jgi:hypothetical protein
MTVFTHTPKEMEVASFRATTPKKYIKKPDPKGVGLFNCSVKNDQENLINN